MDLAINILILVILSAFVFMIIRALIEDNKRIEEVKDIIKKHKEFEEFLKSIPRFPVASSDSWLRIVCDTDHTKTI